MLRSKRLNWEKKKKTKFLKQDYILVYSHQEENAILTFKKNI